MSFLTDNLGLWERNGEDYINLYLYNNELFFSEITRWKRGSAHPQGAGTYVLIGKCEFRKMRDSGGYVDTIGLFYLNGYYGDILDLLRIELPIKKIKIYEIIDYARCVAQLAQPVFIGPNKIDGYSVGAIYGTIERLACEKESIDCYVQQCPLKRYSLEEFLKKDERIYGKEMLKLCYLNPFEFEKEYPELIKESREKKWWQIYQIRRD